MSGIQIRLTGVPVHLEPGVYRAEFVRMEFTAGEARPLLVLRLTGREEGDGDEAAAGLAARAGTRVPGVGREPAARDPG